MQGVWRDRSFQAAIAFGHYLEFSEITLCIMAFEEHLATKGALELEPVDSTSVARIINLLLIIILCAVWSLEKRKVNWTPCLDPSLLDTPLSLVDCPNGILGCHYIICPYHPYLPTFHPRPCVSGCTTTSGIIYSVRPCINTIRVLSLQYLSIRR